jgi:hypothetical protein
MKKGFIFVMDQSADWAVPVVTTTGFFILYRSPFVCSVPILPLF